MIPLAFLINDHIHGRHMRKPNNPNSVLENSLGHRFKDPLLLRQALTHSSYAYEQKPSSLEGASKHNEQFEFLGDAILGFVAGKALFDRFNTFNEGELSRARAQLVSSKYLVEVAKKWQLSEVMLLGRGEERSGGRQKPAILADAVEAVIAAIYLDGGITAARKVILKHIVIPELERLQQEEAGSNVARLDHKSDLQERLQATGAPAPAYHVVTTSGPDHNKVFTVEVRVGKYPGTEIAIIGRGCGPNKKQAEQSAAAEALQQWHRNQAK